MPRPASRRSRPATVSSPTARSPRWKHSSSGNCRELDRKKREELLHQIQRILSDEVVFAPIWENGFIRAAGPRVEEPGLTLIQAFPYSAPLEDVRLKK
jgi:hypothetical protein